MKLGQVPHIIPAIRHSEEWEELANWRAIPKWVFILGGAVDAVAQATGLLQKRGWVVFVHLDMVRGCSTDPEGVRFFAEYAGPNGIISTHSTVIGHAKRAGLLTIQRIFLLDSQSIATGVQQVLSTHPDAVETLPGTLADVTQRVVRELPCPVIAGGLVTTMAEVDKMLTAGARGISTSNRLLWNHGRDAEEGGPDR
jgi:glycerol uptake operon antiterminator